jgi:hypothetical protein
VEPDARGGARGEPRRGPRRAAGGPERQRAAGDRHAAREHEAAVSSIRELTRLAKDLKRRLEAGYERDEIRPFWDGIELLRGDIRAYARHSWLPESTRTKARAAQELLDTLAAYFQKV